MFTGVSHKTFSRTFRSSKIPFCKEAVKERCVCAWTRMKTNI